MDFFGGNNICRQRVEDFAVEMMPREITNVVCLFYWTDRNTN